ncbi:hypothetical protein TUA1478L_04650 [Lactiplantibacillus plantarum]
MANILKRWVESDKRTIRRLDKIANKVEAYADEYGKLSDADLQAKTQNFVNGTRRANRSTICCPKHLQRRVKVRSGYLVYTHSTFKSSVELFCIKVTLLK